MIRSIGISYLAWLKIYQVYSRRATNPLVSVRTTIAEDVPDLGCSRTDVLPVKAHHLCNLWPILHVDWQTNLAVFALFVSECRLRGAVSRVSVDDQGKAHRRQLEQLRHWVEKKCTSCRCSTSCVRRTLRGSWDPWDGDQDMGKTRKRGKDDMREHDAQRTSVFCARYESALVALQRKNHIRTGGELSQVLAD